MIRLIIPGKEVAFYPDGFDLKPSQPPDPSGPIRVVRSNGLKETYPLGTTFEPPPVVRGTNASRGPKVSTVAIVLILLVAGAIGAFVMFGANGRTLLDGATQTISGAGK
jgi:hypothetical protein